MSDAPASAAQTNGTPVAGSKSGNDGKSNGAGKPDSTSKSDSQASGWLPQTGEQIQKWLVATGAMLLAVVGGIAVWLRKRHA
ncbi:LPXTG cell wall anchor domain-containing protein [Lactiplantibacillus plajomi]|uniref:LPXTG cell wall anchor domain-containing protein n=1 Tax=Lactiplantibacillus plajomi TaxID=1457217 RepID=A0ABV6K472_9LACO|nr:LPXTG cell wall anchor domain-containing protein [Lactiplantibacillus plajomi]